MQRLRKETEQDGNARKTGGCWNPDAGEPRNHDDQFAPLTRVIRRAHLKPLLVMRSSSDVEVFDRFLLQLLRAKGIAYEPTDPRQIYPFVCLMPFRPMFIRAAATSSGSQSAADGASGIWQISPVSVRSYVEDLLAHPVLLETFISRGRDLGLTEVRPSILYDELVQIIQLLDVAAAEDLASLQSEERKMLKKLQRKRCAEAKQAAKMKEAAAAAAGDAASGGRDEPDASEECLPRCEDLIVIGIGIGKGVAQKETDDLERRGSSDDSLLRRRKGGRSGGEGEADVDDQGDGRGVGQRGGTGDTSTTGTGSRKKKKKKIKKKKKKKSGKGSSEGSGESGGEEEEDEEEEEEEEKEQENVEEIEGDTYDDEGDRDGIGFDDEDDWDDKLKTDEKDDGQAAEDQTPGGRLLPSLGALALPRGSMVHRGSMYSLQFTPAFVFSYFPTMPPHYIDEANLALLIDRISAKANLKKSR